MLSGFRALDLSRDQSGAFCGKILGDLGIDVIKIERPGGEEMRHVGPYADDEKDLEKSLFWFAFNSSKRGITLDISEAKGKEIFIALVRKSEFVIETFSPGYMTKMGLDYEVLKRINPRIILISITPFGQTGPYSGYKGPDIVMMAMGGMMSINGDADSEPTRLEPGHSFCLAGANAAVGALMAQYHRESSGKGQHVDVSIHDSVVREYYYPVPMWEFEKTVPKRNGSRALRGGRYFNSIYPCKDGYVVWTLFGGPVGERENKMLTEWMDEENISNPLGHIEWESFNPFNQSQETIDLIEERFCTLTMRHTKDELRDEAVKRGIRLAPVDDAKGTYNNQQLKFRDFWVDLHHSELKRDVKYPGRLFISSESECKTRSRAPLIGEHNYEVYGDEIGLTVEEIERLMAEKII